VLETLKGDYGEKMVRATNFDRTPPGDQASYLEWNSMKITLENIDFAYMIIAYPFLDEADKQWHAQPDYDPRKYDQKRGMSPGAYRVCINELKSDAYAHPYEDDERGLYRHRWPIKLNDDELAALGKIVKGRGLPYNPQKREYRFSELIPEKVDVRRSTPMERELQRILKEHSKGS
jgi:hypothetical protein